MTTPQQHYRYVPKRAFDKLAETEYKRIDNLYVIIDLIYRKEIYYKDSKQKNYGYTRIAREQFQKLLGKTENIQKDIQYLVDLGIILQNKYKNHSQGIPMSYKIATEYQSNLTRVVIENKTINKKILKQQEINKAIRVKNLEFQKSRYYKDLRVNLTDGLIAIEELAISEIKELASTRNVELTDEECLDIIHCTNNYKRLRLPLIIGSEENKNTLSSILHKQGIHQIRFHALNDGDFFFKRNETNGRLDTNVTSLPKFLRPYIISTERLYSIDIKNSQPYFLYTQIQNMDIPKDELKRYRDLVLGGVIYKYLEDQYKKLTGYDRNRNQIKEMMFKILYSKPSSFANFKRIFGISFPTIMEYITQTNLIDNSKLSNQLSLIESNAVLDVVMPRLKSIGITPYTIHDSFICNESEVERVTQIFNEELTRLFGTPPLLDIKPIDEIEEEEKGDVEEWTLDDLINNQDDEEHEEHELTRTYLKPTQTHEQIRDMLNNTSENE